MPLEAYRRGSVWWVKGRIEFEGRPISDYLRVSSGASSEEGARAFITETTTRAIREHIVGTEAAFTWDDAVMLYDAKAAEAGFLLKIHEHLTGSLVRDIAPQTVRDLCPKIYPTASADTWKRQVITPVSAVINNAHDLGKCAPIRIKGFSAAQRVAQDEKRGKQSRQKKRPGDWGWIDSLRDTASPYLMAGIEFMFETGARIGQVVAIRPKDLDLPNRRVWIIAQKGHPAQWVAISQEMMVTLANLPPRRPHNRKTNQRLPARVFGYGDRSGFTAALRTACKRAKVDYRSPHAAGRHGFYTELRVRQGIDPITAAAMGRWARASLPDSVYAHAEADEGAIRAAIRTNRVQVISKGKVSAMKPKGKSG
ncbi:phage integrase [Roseivivax marinus]|uniref:Phage integrase n=1 Tax=Roseivivax marinus TaxID=1379903 RepID=W4HEF9_9RHOB|nr:site-specific integrase [Roseivivax marinus]ETW11094.1 phage integrase [Roseivivax marinus]